MVTDSVEPAPAITDDGLNDAVAPVGRPLALKATLWAEPLTTVVEIADVALAPWPRENVDGLAEIEKSSAAVTARDSEVVCVAEVPAPVTVTV